MDRTMFVAPRRLGSERVGEKSRPATRWSPTPSRQEWWLLVVAALVAVSTVAVGARVEDSLTTDTGVNPTVDATAAGDAGAPELSVDPPATATLVAGATTLDVVGGTVSVSTGSAPDATPFTLTTGRVGSFEPGVPALTELDGEVRIAWDGVTEWYRALDGDEVEHGYTIDEPLLDGDTLEIAVDVANANVATDGVDVMLVRDGAPTVWYRNLYVFDATGRTLASSMSAGAGTINITIDTADAVYRSPSIRS